jgi:hypothetical protein
VTGFDMASVYRRRERAPAQSPRRRLSRVNRAIKHASIPIHTHGRLRYMLK